MRITYRNRMFHNGFEWPVESRKSFQALVMKRGWLDRFPSSRTNREPWIFHMSEPFIARCLELVDELLDAVGRHVRRNVAALRDAPSAKPSEDLST